MKVNKQLTLKVFSSSFLFSKNLNYSGSTPSLINNKGLRR
jgi:hypothetical protein